MTEDNLKKIMRKKIPMIKAFVLAAQWLLMGMYVSYAIFSPVRYWYDTIIFIAIVFVGSGIQLAIPHNTREEIELEKSIKEIK